MARLVNSPAQTIPADSSKNRRFRHVIRPNESQSADQPRPAAAECSPAAARAPTRVVLEQGGFLGRWGSRLGWLLFLFALLYIAGMYGSYNRFMQTNPRIEEKFYSHEPMATDKVAIITIEGTILHDDGFAKWQIDQARKDPNVKAVVVRVDSPGGTITGSNYLYHELHELANDPKRPIKLVVSMGGIAASGGYYIAMAVGDVPDTIYCEPTTWTGSIGVIIPHYDISGLLDNWKIQDDSIASNPLKLLGSPTRKVSPELAIKEKAILQTLVDESFKDFKDIVKSGRPKFRKDPKALDDLATGQIYTARQALESGLVDKLGYLDDAVKRAIELQHLNADSVQVVKYARPQGLLGDVLGANGSAQNSRLGIGGTDLAALLDLTAPRAYYLWTWLPAMVSQRPE